MRSTLVELLAWLCRRRARFCVGGRSMLPTLRAGEVVLVNPHGIPVVGSLVIAAHPTDEMTLLVKRVESVDASGRFFLVSDNVAEGCDSRDFGPVDPGRVRGTVVLSLEEPVTSGREFRKRIASSPQ